MTHETSDPVRPTPWHLWLIGGVALLWNGFGAIDFAATVTRFEPYLKDFGGFTDEQIDYYLSFPWWQFVLWFVGTWGGFLGAIALLMKRKWAVWLFGASLLGALGSMIHGMSLKDIPEGLDPGLLTYVIIAIAAALFVYAWQMSKRGLLR